MKYNIYKDVYVVDKDKFIEAGADLDIIDEIEEDLGRVLVAMTTEEDNAIEMFAIHNKPDITVQGNRLVITIFVLDRQDSNGKEAYVCGSDLEEVAEDLELL